MARLQILAAPLLVLLGLMSLGVIQVASSANTTSSNPEVQSGQPRTARDVALPLCGDIERPASNSLESKPTGPPVLPRDGQPGNVRCVALGTATDTPTPRASPNIDSLRAPTEQLLAPTVYRHVGAEVANNSVLQVTGDVEVSDPSVPHNGGEDHHFVARYLAEKENVAGAGCPDDHCWIEAGWGGIRIDGG